MHSMQQTRYLTSTHIPLSSARQFADNDSTSWNVKLSQIAFALRTAPSEPNGTSPTILMLGRHPRQPSDLLLPSPTINDDLPSPESASDNRKHLLAELLPAYKTVCEKLDPSHQTLTRNYDVHHHSLPFKEDDLVWLANLSGIAMGKSNGTKFQH